MSEKEKQIDADVFARAVIQSLLVGNDYNAGYRKQSEDAIVLPCKAGDLVRFKGLETPLKVTAVHFYAEGQPQISISSETGKITSTMTENEFYMSCDVLDEAKMKGGAE